MNKQTRTMFVKVAGVTFDNRQAVIAQLAGGEPVKIVPEPDNRYDPNALAIHVALPGNGIQHIGYVPRDLAADFAPLLDGEAVIGRVSEVTGGFEKSDGSTASYGVIVAFEIPTKAV